MIFTDFSVFMNEAKQTINRLPQIYTIILILLKKICFIYYRLAELVSASPLIARDPETSSWRQ